MEKCSVFHDWLVTHCSVWDFTTRPSENLNHVSTAFLISQLGPDCITLADICFAYFLFCCEYFKSFLKKKKKKWNLILAACFLPFFVCSGFFWAAITCHFTVLKAEDQWGLPGPQPQHLAIFLQRHPSGAVLNLSPQVPLLQCLERATCPWWPCLSRRLGPDDLQRRLPASAKLWFWFSSSGQALALPWHQTPPLLSSSFPAQVPTSDAPQLQQVVVGHRHQQSLVPFPSPMQETIIFPSAVLWETVGVNSCRSRWFRRRAASASIPPNPFYWLLVEEPISTKPLLHAGWDVAWTRAQQWSKAASRTICNSLHTYSPWKGQFWYWLCCITGDSDLISTVLKEKKVLVVHVLVQTWERTCQVRYNFKILLLYLENIMNKEWGSYMTPKSTGWCWQCCYKTFTVREGKMPALTILTVFWEAVGEQGSCVCSDRLWHLMSPKAVGWEQSPTRNEEMGREVTKHSLFVTCDASQQTWQKVWGNRKLHLSHFWAGMSKTPWNN